MLKFSKILKKAAVISLCAASIMSLSSCSGSIIPGIGSNSTHDINATGIGTGNGNLIGSADHINPLTGLECSEEQATRRPIAIMINNLKKAQPQFGISHADIIYECNAEGGVNRLMALFSDYSTIETLGSVRSARDYFVNLAVMHDAVFVHAGGASDAYDFIDDNNIENIDGVNGGGTEGATFWRDPDRKKNMGYEHSLMTSGANISDTIKALGFSEKRKASSTMYKFATTAKQLEFGIAMTHVTIPHSNSITAEFDYNSSDGLYYRSQFGKEHIDAETGEQLRFTNVVMLFTKQVVTDEKGRLDVYLTGDGDGYYLYGGKYIPITWKRDNEGDFITLLNVDGTELSLNPGKSFISVCDKKIYDTVEFS